MIMKKCFSSIALIIVINYGSGTRSFAAMKLHKAMAMREEEDFGGLLCVTAQNCRRLLVISGS